MEFMQTLDALNVDTATLLARFSNNAALLERFVRKFPQDKTYGELSAAWEAGDRDALARAAHTMKGMSVNLGFNLLSERCDIMVQHLRAGAQEPLQTDFAVITQEYEKIKGLILEMN